MWECRETYVCLGCLRQRSKTAFTFSSKCCLWHHIISEAVKPKNISSDAQMFGGVYMWWPEISSARLISEKKKKKNFLCFLLYIRVVNFCSLCHCSLSCIVYAHLCFYSTSALLSTPALLSWWVVSAFLTLCFFFWLEPSFLQCDCLNLCW